MPKSVITLVKELGAKNTAEVIELLRQVGVDTDAEGFGVMTKVDDETIVKLHNFKKSGPVAERKPAPRRRIDDLDEPVSLDLDATKVKRKVKKDFFGTQQADAEIEEQLRELESAAKSVEPAKVEVPEIEKAEAGVEKPAEPASRPKENPKGTPAAQPVKKTISQTKPQQKPKPQTPKPGPRPAQSAKPGQAKSTKKAIKPDLSQGPRIISMPDPAEQARLRAQRDAPRGGGQAPAGGRAEPASATANKKKPVRGRQVKGKEAEPSGRRRKIKEIGGTMDDGRVRSRKRVFKVAGKRAEEAPQVVHHIKISGQMTLRDVAKKTGIKVAQIVRFLMQDLGIMANINYVASVDEIQLIAENFEIQHTIDLEWEPETELAAFEEIDDDKLEVRPPVVTVMGHVDHGKTKLLDTIRQANVVAGEAGGITQHIGAYQVRKKGKHITFIDTPGHEAFTAMRARGSQVTDIVILIVAADDGIMPQTVEAIDHARAAEVPIIVAINKIDRANANPDRVMNQLAEHQLVPEEWGGDTMVCRISALKGEGIDELLDMVLLTAELVDPKADPHAPPFGVVIESQVDTGIGVVATVLVKQGSMAKGQFLLSGTHIGRIKRMENDHGEEVHKAGPSYPCRIIGFSEPPENGDKVYTFKNKKQAQSIADQRLGEMRKIAAAGASGRMSLEAFFQKAEAGETKDLDVLIKADVGGSAEALADALKKIDIEGMKCNVISARVGQVNDTDINLAAASGAVILGFNVTVSSTAKKLIEKERVDVRLYDIIYKVTEDIELAMKGLLAPEFEEKELGRVEIRAIFKQDKSGTVCGCYVLDGVVKRGSTYRIKRAGEIVYENMRVNSLKRFKDDAREVLSGFECGMYIEKTDIAEGDILEIFEIVEKARF